MINIIAAISKNNVLGKDNKLLWHLPNDLKYFKKITTGKTVVMGRKTFESIGKPLPNRRNIVVSNRNLNIENVEIVNNIKDIISLNDDIFIIGGGEIYKSTINLADKLYITLIDFEFSGDVYFPDIDLTKWKITNKEYHQKDEKNKYDYTFIIYERI